MPEINSSVGLESSLASADLLVVGSGFFGLTVAERAASTLGARVVVVEQRGHIGGNAFSFFEDESGIEVHKYGTHIFHTSSERVWDYVRDFTSFNDYRHRVFTVHGNQVYSLPINLGTICQFLGRSVSPLEARHWIEAQAEGVDASTASNLEDRAIGLVGKSLYEVFIKGYTKKQWQTDPRSLPAEIISRLPVRYTFESGYFNDQWEGIPTDGYTSWLHRMAASPQIEIRTDTSYGDIQHLLVSRVPIVYTGPIDAFFDYRAGPLSWRTLDLDLEVLDVSDFQGTSVMNFADADVPFTRIHEFKHLHPERANSSGKTAVMREYSRFANRLDEPFYPVNGPEDRKRLAVYRQLAKKQQDVVFGGRLGTYKYLDMHMAIASALSTFDREIEPRIRARRE